MKKSRIIALSLSLIMLVSALFAFTVPAVAAGEENEYSGFYEKADKDASTYAYSIAVIGDTQTLSDSDYENRNNASYTKRMDTLYSWLQNNIESKKIGLVMGLGDIVENWQNPLDYPDYEGTELGNQSVWEWENAGRVFNTYLEDENGVKVPYTLVRGNHDSANSYNTFIAGDNMSTYREQFNSENAGFYVDSNGATKYGTSYMKLTIGETKWLVATLDWSVTERELDWLGELVSANPDHRVILTMHTYLYHDKTLNAELTNNSPNENWDYKTDMRADNKTEANPEGPVYNPDGVWERLASRYSNIELVLSGHIPNGAPQMSQLVGDNGNTVTQMLIDPQSMDLPANNTSGCGMVAMLYFNEDGTLADSQWDEKTIDLEWYSTIKSKYYKEANQFTINVDLYDGGTKTEKYGIIPSEYADTEKYPFVTFGYDKDIDEYFFMGAYSSWSDNSTGAYPALSTISGGAKDVPAYVLLRRDYTSEISKAYAMGKLTLSEVNLDLNGYTVITGNNPFFSTNLGTANAKTTLNVFGKEGSKILNGSSYRAFIAMGATSTGAGASFTYNFNGITFGFAEGTTTTKLVAETFDMTSSGNSPITISQYLNFENCTFDLETNKPSNNVTLFKLNEAVGAGYNVCSTSVNIDGGKIISDDLSKAIICAKNDTDSFTASFSDGAVYTEHGMIPASNTNPFVLFKNGGYVNSYTTWAAAVNAAVALDSTSDRVIYMTKDYTSTAQPSIGNLRGNLLIDLGGHTLTSSGKYGFNSYFANTEEGASMAIAMKNGTVVNSYKNGFMLLNTSPNQTQELKIDVLFENVTFSNTTTGAYIFKAWSAIKGTATPGLDVNAVMNGCTINYDGNAKPFELVFGNEDKEVFDLALNGCDIVSTKKANIAKGALFSKDAEDTVTFGTYNGKATTFKSADKAYTITEAIENKDTVTVFAYTSDNVLYTAKTAARAAETPAGYSAIPDIYPKELYPFAVYNDGTVTPYISWYQAVYFNESTNGTILLRRDYSTDECHNATQSFYVKENCVVDLGGHVFTRGAQHIIQAYGKSTSETSTVTNLTVKNGVFLVVKNPVLIFNNASNTGNNAIFNVTFDNVTFALAKNATASDLIISNYTGGGYGSIGNIVFDNCTIDLTKNDAIGSIALANNITIFDLASDSGKNFTSVKYIGGKIIANDMSKVTLFELGASGTDKAGNPVSDSFEFAKNDGEGYTKLVLSSGVAAPTAEYNGLKFVKESENGTTTTYVLVPAASIGLDFTPKASVTLDSNLIFNIYIPATDMLVSATLDGEAITLGEAVDGYYLVSVELPACEAAREMALAVSLNVDGALLKGTFTFSVPKYSAKVLNNADATETEKTLVKDVLAYVKAAYNYFTTFNTAEEIARVNALINSIIGDYTSAPVSSGVTNTVAPVTGVTLNLDSKPSIRFYVTDTSVSFYANGRKLDTVSGTDANGTYVELDVYAYALCETITYGDGGSYHISNFLKNAAGTDYENLVACFIKYTESAAAYRNSVIGA